MLTDTIDGQTISRDLLAAYRHHPSRIGHYSQWQATSDVALTFSEKMANQ